MAKNFKCVGLFMEKIPDVFKNESTVNFNCYNPQKNPISQTYCDGFGQIPLLLGNHKLNTSMDMLTGPVLLRCIATNSRKKCFCWTGWLLYKEGKRQVRSVTSISE
jgi:hypothetical protein